MTDPIRITCPECGDHELQVDVDGKHYGPLDVEPEPDVDGVYFPTLDWRRDCVYCPDCGEFTAGEVYDGIHPDPYEPKYYWP